MSDVITYLKERDYEYLAEIFCSAGVTGWSNLDGFADCPELDLHVGKSTCSDCEIILCADGALSLHCRHLCCGDEMSKVNKCLQGLTGQRTRAEIEQKEQRNQRMMAKHNARHRQQAMRQRGKNAAPIREEQGTRDMEGGAK